MVVSQSKLEIKRLRAFSSVVQLKMGSKGSSDIWIVLAQSGNNPFKSPVRLTIAQPSGSSNVAPGGLVARDFNGDGNLDLAN